MPDIPASKRYSIVIPLEQGLRLNGIKRCQVAGYSIVIPLEQGLRHLPAWR